MTASATRIVIEEMPTSPGAAALLLGLCAIRQEVVREAIQAVDKAVPSPHGRQQEHPIADRLEHDVIAFETEFPWKPDALASTIAKQLSCLHGWSIFLVCTGTTVPLRRDQRPLVGLPCVGSAVALGGFAVPVQDQQLFRPKRDHGVRLPPLIREFHQNRPVAVPFEMLDHSANLPAREAVLGKVFG